MKIYVGCAIQGLAPEHWDAMKSKLENLKLALRKKGHEVLNFRSDGNRQAVAGTVFKWDYQQCMECDAMIALALYPSTGMGMEMILCLTKPNPAFVLATAPKGNNTNHMVTECNLPGYVYKEFETWGEIPDLFEMWHRRKGHGELARQSRLRKFFSRHCNS